MSDVGSAQPQVTISQYHSPQTTWCGSRGYRSSTTPDLTELLVSGAKYWNNARRIANERMGRVETQPLVRIASNPDDLVGSVFSFSICDCEGSRGRIALSRICIDPSSRGDSLYTVIHEVGHAVIGIGGNPLLDSDGHASQGTKSVLLPGGAQWDVFKRYPCNLDPDHPLEFDIQLAENLSINQFSLDQGPYRTVLKDQPFQQSSYPVCELIESIPMQVRQALKRQTAGVAIGFFTVIVMELLDMPQIKALPHYNIIQKGAKILPHILFIALTVVGNGVGLGAVLGIGSMLIMSSLQSILRQCKAPEDKAALKACCYYVLTHPLLPTFLSPLLIFAGNASGLYGLPETHTVFGVVSEGVMAVSGSILGFVLGLGAVKSAKVSVKFLNERMQKNTQILSNPNDTVIDMDGVDTSIELVDFSNIDVGALENEQPCNRSVESVSSTDVVIEMEDGLMNLGGV